VTGSEVIVARGWATVELERAAIERHDDLAVGSAFEPAPRSTALGAACLRGRAADGGGWIVLLEPDIEGPIGAYLARQGEGWAATWRESTRDEESGRRRWTEGPCGLEILEPGGPRHGPFRLRTVAATIGA
jgi:hypothetical protein